MLFALLKLNVCRAFRCESSSNQRRFLCDALHSPIVVVFLVFSDSSRGSIAKIEPFGGQTNATMPLV